MQRTRSHTDEQLEMPPGAETLAYFQAFTVIGVITLVFTIFWRDMFLVDMGQYAYFDVRGVGAVWYLFVFALVAALLLPGAVSYASRGTLFGRAILLSLNAGFWEEIIYRWLLFLTAMVTLPFFNFITFGLVHWLFEHLYIPVVNFFTFGLMHEHLYTANWVLGAALVSALSTFRDDHRFHGPLGRIVVWYIGMLLFWVMFNYGIITAMVVHALYDMIVLGIYALKVRDPHPLESFFASLRS